MQQRYVTKVVVTSWDNFLSVYVDVLLLQSLKLKVVHLWSLYKLPVFFQKNNSMIYFDVSHVLSYLNLFYGILFAFFFFFLLAFKKLNVNN